MHRIRRCSNKCPRMPALIPARPSRNVVAVDLKHPHSAHFQCWCMKAIPDGKHTRHVTSSTSQDMDLTFRCWCKKCSSDHLNCTQVCTLLFHCTLQQLCWCVHFSLALCHKKHSDKRGILQRYDQRRKTTKCQHLVSQMLFSKACDNLCSPYFHQMDAC
jgi:hypothetical protein